MANVLMELLVRVATNYKAVDKELLAMEKRGQKTEDRLSHIGDGMAKNIEKNVADSKKKLADLEKAFESADEAGKIELEVELKNAKAAVAEAEHAKEVFENLDGKTATVNIESDGGVATNRVIESVLDKAERLDGKNASVIIGGAATVASAIATNAVIQTVGERLDLLTRTTDALAAQAMPLMFGTAAGGTGVVTALGTATLGLASALGQGTAGFVTIGGAAGAAAYGGLAAYGGAASIAVKGALEVRESLADQRIAAEQANIAVRDARKALSEATPGTAAYRDANATLTEALNEQEDAQRELLRLETLATPAALKFGDAVDSAVIPLTRVQAELGNRVLPAFTRLIGLGLTKLPVLTPPLYDMAEGVSLVGERIVGTVLEGEHLAQIGNVMDFISRSTISATWVFGNFGRAGLGAVQGLIAPADRLWGRLHLLSAATYDWTRSAEGVKTIDAVVSQLETRMNQTLSVVVNFGRGIAGIFSAISASGVDDSMIQGLMRISHSFAQIGSEGSKSRQVIIEFAQQGTVLFSALGSLTGEIGSQFLRLAQATLGLRMEGSKTTVLVAIFQALEKAVGPVADMMLQTFRDLGPLLPGLIVQIGQLLGSFGGSSPVLKTYLSAMTTLLETFNELPGPAKTIITNLVALSTIMGATSGISIPGMIAGLASARLSMVTFALATGNTVPTLRQIGPAMLGIGTAGKTASTGATAAGAAAAASGARMGFFARAGAVASAAMRGLGVALRFMLGPWGLLIAAIALGVTLIVKNWSSIRPALQPVIDLFNRAMQIGRDLAGVFGGVLTGNLESARKSFFNLPAGLRPLALTLAEVAAKVRLFVTQGLLYLRAQGMRLMAWWKSNWPQIRSVVVPVLTAVGSALRTILGGALRFAMQNAQIFINWLRTNWPLIRATARTVFGAVRTVIVGAFTAISSIVRPIISGLVSFWRMNSTQFTTIARSAWTIIKTLIQSTLRIILSIFKLAMQVITGDWSGAWATIRQILSTASGAIQTILRALGSIAISILQVAWNTLKSLTSAAWSAIRGYIEDQISKARSRFEEITGAIVSYAQTKFSELKDKVTSAMQAVGEALWKPVESGWSKAKEIWNTIVSTISGIMEKLGIPGADTVGDLAMAQGGVTQGAGDAARGRRGAARGRVHRYATGGLSPHYVTDDTWINYGEELRGSEREYFIPTGERHHRRARQLWSMAGQDLGLISQSGERPGTFLEVARFAGGGFTEKEIRDTVSWAEGYDGSPYTWGGSEPGATDCSGWQNHVYLKVSGGTPSGRSPFGATSNMTDATMSGLGFTKGEVNPGYNVGVVNGGPGGGHTAGTLAWGSGEINTETGGGAGGDGSITETGGSAWGATNSYFSHLYGLGEPGNISGAGGGGGVMDWLRQQFEKQWENIVAPLKKQLDSLGSHVLVKGVGKLAVKSIDGLRDWILAKIPGGSGGGGGAGGGATGGEIKDWAADGLSYGGRFEPTPENIDKIVTLAMKESGGDPNATNSTGSGASGLMQVMPQTFDAYKVSGGDDIFNPRHNVAASSRYQSDRYGGLVTFSPYSEGGIATGPQWMYLAEEGAQELVTPLAGRGARIARDALGIGELAQSNARLEAEFRRLGQNIRDGIRVEDFGNPATGKMLGAQEQGSARYARSEDGRSQAVKAARKPLEDLLDK